jgi:hypothetical protein
MTAPIPPARPEPAPREPSPRPRVYASQLWPGGIATAIVAGLVALVGVLASRWLFNVPILSPRAAGTYGDVHTTGLVLAAAAAALLATAVLHLLLLSVPSPVRFFVWIITLATAVAILLAFQTGAPMTQRIATAVVYALIGVAIGSLLSSVAQRAVRYTPAGADPAGYLPPDYRRAGYGRDG